MEKVTLVEETLRTQRDHWREISERVASLSSREFPHEAPKRVLLFGVGSSHFAARFTALTLLRDRSRARLPVIACPSQSVGSEVIPARGDWAFGFSHRGCNPITLQALELADRVGAFTILVCAKGSRSPEYARFVLETVPPEKVEPHTAALTGAVCGATSLLIGPRAIEEWDAVRSIGEPDLDLMKRRGGNGPTVILGEWEGEWLAREGALKMMEMARVPVRAYGSEEFFHGPHWALSAEDRLWHVSVPRDTRQGQIRANHSIGIYGSTPLAWVPALVELQWLALAVAINRGIDPDLAPNSRPKWQAEASGAA